LHDTIVRFNINIGNTIIARIPNIKIYIEKAGKTRRRVNVDVIGEVRPLLLPPIIPDGVDDVVSLLRHCVVFNVFPRLSRPVRVKEEKPPDAGLKVFLR
jgi:hypothetical protein